MLPMCPDVGVGCVPYSPQGEGRVTNLGARRPIGRPSMWWRNLSTWMSTSRSWTRSSALPESRGVPMSKVGLAWLLANAAVDCGTAVALRGARARLRRTRLHRARMHRARMRRARMRRARFASDSLLYGVVYPWYLTLLLHAASLVVAPREMGRVGLLHVQPCGAGSAVPIPLRN